MAESAGLRQAINGKLLISIANCPSIHAAHEPMPFDQADLLFRISKEYGVPVSAAEFTNEPSLIALSGLPQGYTAADHARDHDLFGTWLKTCYVTGEEIREGAHVYCHSRKDGYAYLIVNNSLTETTSVELPKEADVYALTGNGKLRSRTMLLNSKELILGENDELPELCGVTVSGKVEIASDGCTFIVI